ncbi:hypothetical protein DFH28DRAFT_1079967 [Melampsora americana]|nr:hypothetical protein DFH28DRAFT_1079967 [Melampsora americana]
MFERNVKKFNIDFPTDQPILCPPFEDMKRLSLADRFWDIGQLTHPEQPWAVDQDTQDGIWAYLEMTHASDELRRIGRELRQSMNWALGMEEKVDTNKWIVDVVRAKIALPDVRLNKSKEVLRSLYSRMEQDHARLMIVWNCGMLDMLSKTKGYCQLAEDTEEGLRVRWLDLVVRSRLTWSAGAQEEIVKAVPLDEDKEAELLLDLDGDNGYGRDGEDELFEIADEVDKEIVDEIDEDIGGVVDGA